MSQPTALTVAAPKLTGSKVGTATRIDRPVQIGLAPVKLPDGGTLAADAEVGVLVYRVNDNGEQIWNVTANAWQTSPAEVELGKSLLPTPLSFTGGTDQAWQATLNAAPQVDASGAPLYEIAPKDNPKYFVRAVVSATVGDVAYHGLSSPSEMLSFASVTAISPSAPQLSWKGGGLWAPIERPVAVGLTDLTYPDGTDVNQDEVIKVGVFIYRTSGEMWNEKEQHWQTAPASAESMVKLDPLALTFSQDQAQHWSGELVAMGQVDRDGAPRFVPINQGGSTYRLRVFAHVRKDGLVYLGLGPFSAALTFVKLVGEERFKMEFDTDSPQDCTEATIRLRDASGARTGFFRLKANPRELDLANCDAGGNVLASIRLTSGGDVELTPDTGKRVLVRGDIEADGTQYLSNAGGTMASIRVTAGGDVELRPANGKRVLMLGDIEAERIYYRPNGGGRKRYL